MSRLRGWLPDLAEPGRSGFRFWRRFVIFRPHGRPLPRCRSGRNEAIWWG